MNLRISSLEGFRRIVAKGLTVLAAAHVPCLIVIAWLLNGDVLTITWASVLFAALPAGLLYLNRPTFSVSMALTVALVGQTSLLVYLFQGHAWQTEMHFYYFAVLAMLSGFCGWIAITLASALIAGQHLVFNFLLPDAIYGGGSDFARVLVHGFIVVVESSVLIAIGWVIRSAFQELDETRSTAERAATELEAASRDREITLSETTARADELQQLLARFETEMSESIDVLHVNASGLLKGADRLGESAARTSGQVVNVSAASETTSRTVASVAGAGQELSRTITEVGDSAARSSQLAAAAVAEANRTSKTMDEMAAVSAEIGVVTELIKGIADQTNLLALNATIEAARAGETGRGFSVVAQEVKALSSQTAKATQEITARVSAMQGTATRSVVAIQAVSDKIHALEGVARGIAGAVHEQVSATEDIAGNVTSAADAVSHVQRSIAEIAALTDANTQDVGEVSAAARQVAEQTATIRKRVRAFTTDITRIRA